MVSAFWFLVSDLTLDDSASAARESEFELLGRSDNAELFLGSEVGSGLDLREH